MARNYVIKSYCGKTEIEVTYDGRVASENEYINDPVFQKILSRHEESMKNLQRIDLETRVEIK